MQITVTKDEALNFLSQKSSRLTGGSKMIAGAIEKNQNPDAIKFIKALKLVCDDMVEILEQITKEEDKPKEPKKTG